MAADETYRRFHAGRFGPETIKINFETEIEGSKGVTSSPKNSPNADQKKYKEDVSSGKSVPRLEGE